MIKHRISKAKAKARGTGMRDAYDINEAKQQCKKKGFLGRIAFAWLEGGRVQTSFDLTRVRKDPRRSIDHLCRLWIKEAAIGKSLTARITKPSKRAQQRFVRCVVASNGASWFAWKELEVCRVLLNPPKTPKGKGWCFTPLEYTIFDPDTAPGVWIVKDQTKTHDHCIDFGLAVLNEVARVYCRGVEAIAGFEKSFAALNANPFPAWSRGARPAKLLHNCKNAAIRLINEAATAYVQKRMPNAAVALRQGLLIGAWLAEAEAITSNVGAIALVSQTGTGRPSSRLWEWIKTDPRFLGKTAKEALLLLDGCWDPDHKGRKLKVVEGGLKRGNNKLLKTESFLSKFSVRKTTLFQR